MSEAEGPKGPEPSRPSADGHPSPVPALRCECGKLLKLPETVGANRFRCPACGRAIILRFEAPPRPAPPPLATPGPAGSPAKDEAPGEEAGARQPDAGAREAGAEEEPKPYVEGFTPQGPTSAAFARVERLLLEEARFLAGLGYLASEGWVMTFQRPDLPPEQEPPTSAEDLTLCVGRLVQSDHFVPVILVVPVVEAEGSKAPAGARQPDAGAREAGAETPSDSEPRQALVRGLGIARRTTPVPVPLCLVTRGDRRRMFQSEGERPYDTVVEATNAIGYLRGRSQRLVPSLRLVDYPLLVREIVSVLESEGLKVGFDGAAFRRELRERFGTEDPEGLRLLQARDVTAGLLERFASRTPYRLLDIRLLTDQPAPEFDRLGTIVREKLAFEEYVDERREHVKRMFNILSLGCFVAIFFSLAESVILPASILALTMFLVFAQEYQRPVPPKLSAYEVPRTLLWDRSVIERVALGSLFLVVLLLRLFFWQ